MPNIFLRYFSDTFIDIKAPFLYILNKEKDHHNKGIQNEYKQCMEEEKDHLNEEKDQWSSQRQKKITFEDVQQGMLFTVVLRMVVISAITICHFVYKEIFDVLWDGAGVMADKCFTIEAILLHEIVLNLPPFSKKGLPFSLDEKTKTKQITSTRIHVERAISRAKRFKILSDE
eukprot:Pgem_evm1s3795